MKALLKSGIIAFAALLALASCGDDKFTPSIYDTNDYPLDQSLYTFPLDSFIKREFLEPYNVKFIYRMQDVGSDMYKNLTPAPYDKSVQLAALAKWLWFDCYTTLAQEKEVFLKKYSPRILHLIGSKNYNPTEGSEVLGVAEGGIKITLYNVDNLDVSDIAMMNEYFFKTMHHEFSHILDQTYIHPLKFNLISTGMYDAMGWTEAADSVVLGKGFVSPYGSSAVTEDWVETIACYVTCDSVQWNKMLNASKADWEEVDCEDYQAYLEKVKGSTNLDTIGYFKENTNGEGKIYRRVYRRNADDTMVYDSEGKPIPENAKGFVGYDIILEKLEMTRQWLNEYFHIDIDKLRYMVQERMYLKNADGTWALDAEGNQVNRLTSPEGGYPRLIDKLTDQIYGLKAK